MISKVQLSLNNNNKFDKFFIQIQLSFIIYLSKVEKLI
jgi:hypothetical protein